MNSEVYTIAALDPVEIVTERSDLVLRLLSYDDSSALFNLIETNREYLRKFVEPVAVHLCTKFSVIYALARFSMNANHAWWFGLWYKDSLIGDISLRADFTGYKRAVIGYFLAEAYTRQGYMTTAVTSLTEYAFSSLEFQSVVAHVHKENIASQRVLQKSGFHITSEGVYKNDSKITYLLNASGRAS